MTHRARTILAATALCGSLDILSAFLFNAIDGVGVGTVLRFVASGPFGDSMRQGGAGAAVLGLAVHFGIMFIMSALFVGAASRFDLLRRQWPMAGLAYGLLIYSVMYWLVLPARFGSYPQLGWWSVGNALFSHIACVGLPMAWLVSRMKDGERPASDAASLAKA